MRAADADAGARTRLPVWVGVDASTKRDSTALVAVTFDKKSAVRAPGRAPRVHADAGRSDRLRGHRRGARCSIGAQRFLLRQVLFDPFQMAAVAQRLAKAHVPIEEYPQTVPNLTAATQQPVRPDPARAVRALSRRCHAAWRSRARSSSRAARGWRLDKLKQQHKIDVVVALCMACLAAVRGQGKPGYDLFAPGLFDDDDAEDKQAGDERYRRELGAHIYACTGIWPR